jgi:trehalose synthase
VSLLTEVHVPPRPVTALEPLIGPERHARLLTAAARFRYRFAGRTIWNVNSTASGGGVAEMLQALVGYATGLGAPVRWVVLRGDPEFYAITKRLHNQLHGDPGPGPLGTAEAAHYREVLAANAAELIAMAGADGIFLLHDPQTAGLAVPLARAGGKVVWRSHVGIDWENDATRAAWDFLRPFLAPARGLVFSRRQYVPSWVPPELTWIVPPSIDPFSAKNQHLGESRVRAILTAAGILDDPCAPRETCFVRRDGSTGRITRAAAVTSAGLPKPGDPVVVQVSRWDRLKDMAGVMRGFAEHVAPHGPGFLILAGPDVTRVTDDPEGAEVFAECLGQWQELPPAVRARVVLAMLPLDDIDENAAMVNALQRYAAVIVQKSLAEGFGLTVAEGMWKGRPVLGSAVGGIADQIADGTGILLPDPHDLPAFGAAVRSLLGRPEVAARMGAAARAHIQEHYLGDVHLLRYARLFDTVAHGGD